MNVKLLFVGGLLFLAHLVQAAPLLSPQLAIPPAATAGPDFQPPPGLVPGSAPIYYCLPSGPSALTPVRPPQDPELHWAALVELPEFSEVPGPIFTPDATPDVEIFLDPQAILLRLRGFLPGPIQEFLRGFPPFYRWLHTPGSMLP